MHTRFFILQLSTFNLDMILHSIGSMECRQFQNSESAFTFIEKCLHHYKKNYMHIETFAANGAEYGSG